MTAAQQWTKLRNPLETIPFCWPRGADAEQSSLSSLEMPRADSAVAAGAFASVPEPRRARRRLVLPEPFETIRRQSRVAHRRRDRAVPEVVLDRSRVLAIVRKLVAAGMPQHVAVDREGEARGLASPRDHALIAGNAQGRQAFGNNT